jgi:holo-[acyl-carrier protein] synthase
MEKIIGNKNVFAIGVDIVKISRMKEISGRWGEKFLQRVFTEGEIAYCSQKKNPYRSFAVRFAAKEAVIKAIAAAIPVSLTDIEVILSENGKPELKFTGTLRKFFEQHDIKKAHLSLSHEEEYGIAFVVLEQ